MSVIFFPLLSVKCKSEREADR